VELGTALAFTAIALRLNQLKLLPALPAYLYFAAIGIALALIDLDCHRLPNAIVLPSYPTVLVLLTVASMWQQDWSALLRALIGSVALFSFYFVVAFAYPAGMGFGDVKLAGLIGAILAYLSYPTLLVGAFAGFLLGGLFGVAVIASRRGSGKTALPFGPFMICGALLAIFVATPIADLYSRQLIGT
jgi:leader peptidase (prepilin peptidase)/N-methyltransferase